MPRRFNYKNIFKRRFLRFSKNKTQNTLVYGTVGLLILQPLRLTSKQIQRQKTLIKRGSRRVDVTRRRVWFNIFPHIPLSKKVTGSRMGKGVGKLSGWATELPAGIFLFEYRNLRVGRSLYYIKQIQYRLSCKSRLYSKELQCLNSPLTSSRKVNCVSFW